MSSIIVVLLLIVATISSNANEDQKEQSSFFESCMGEVLKPKFTSDTEIEFYKTAFDEIVDERSPPECMAGMAFRKEINDVSNFIDHLYVKGCVQDAAFLKSTLRQETCSYSTAAFLNTRLMSCSYFSDTIEERNYTTFVYSCCKLKFKSEPSTRTSLQRTATENYISYLLKKKMIESVGNTLESSLAEWRAKQTHLQSTTSQGKTTRGITATALPTLDPGDYTIAS